MTSTIVADDSDPYYPACSLTLSEASSNTIYTTAAFSATGGTGSITIYFKTVGSMSLSTSCSSVTSNSLALTVTKRLLVIDSTTLAAVIFI